MPVGFKLFQEYVQQGAAVNKQAIDSLCLKTSKTPMDQQKSSGKKEKKKKYPRKAGNLSDRFSAQIYPEPIPGQSQKSCASRLSAQNNRIEPCQEMLLEKQAGSWKQKNKWLRFLQTLLIWVYQKKTNSGIRTTAR